MKKDIQAKAEMLVRRPVAEVFDAFIYPEFTTKFWFTKSSGKLELGKEILWEWEMFGVSTKVRVDAIEQNKRILIQWDGYNGRESVEWTFTALEDEWTFVRVTNYGFHGTDDEIVSQALDSTGGFTSLLAGLKAYLEHDVQLNLVADSHPTGA
jgi:uncharacterized protein YndB with AHSA1/START domain